MTPVWDLERDRVNAARKVLRAILKRMRWDDQGGYPSRYDGKWQFVSAGLPQTTPAELDTLFAFAGIVPDEIQSLGDCETCKHSKLYADGSRGEQGYSTRECSTCKRPRMSNYEPLTKIRKKRTR